MSRIVLILIGFGCFFVVEGVSPAPGLTPLSVALGRTALLVLGCAAVSVAFGRE